MKQIATLVNTTLTQNEAINELLEGRVFWGLAEEAQNIKQVFCIYSLQGETGYTKDSGNQYYVTLRLFGNSLNKVVDVGDVIVSELEENTGWRFINGEADYVFQDNSQYAMRELKFKIQ